MHHHHPLPFILFLIHFFFFKQNLYKFFFLKFNVFLQLLSKYVFHISVFQVCSFFFNRKQSFLQSKTTDITTRITATATDSSFNPTWGLLRQRNVAVAYCWRRVLFFLVTIHGRLHVRTTRPSLAQTPRPRHIRRSATPPSRRGRSHQDGQTCISPMSAQLLHHHEIGSPIKFGDLIVSRRSAFLFILESKETMQGQYPLQQQGYPPSNKGTTELIKCVHRQTTSNRHPKRKLRTYTTWVNGLLSLRNIAGRS